MLLDKWDAKVMGEFIERAHDWFKNKSDILDKKKFVTKITYASSTPNPAVRLDIDSEQYVSTIAVWASGDSEMQILDVTTGHPLIERRDELGRDCNFDVAFKEFFMLLENC